MHINLFHANLRYCLQTLNYYYTKESIGNRPQVLARTNVHNNSSFENCPHVIYIMHVL